MWGSVLISHTHTTAGLLVSTMLEGSVLISHTHTTAGLLVSTMLEGSVLISHTHTTAGLLVSTMLEGSVLNIMCRSLLLSKRRDKLLDFDHLQYALDHHSESL